MMIQGTLNKLPLKHKSATDKAIENQVHSTMSSFPFLDRKYGK